MSQKKIQSVHRDGERSAVLYPNSLYFDIGGMVCDCADDLEWDVALPAQKSVGQRRRELRSLSPLAIPLRIFLFEIYELNSRLIDPAIATSTIPVSVRSIVPGSGVAAVAGVTTNWSPAPTSGAPE